MPFHPLENTVQRYDWGSMTALQELLGQEVDGAPAAELWMGAHPMGPSMVRAADGSVLSLAELIRSAPSAHLGTRVLEDYGPRLPYLLKVLAADKALSLQVHPKPHLARAGFNRENRAGLAKDSPVRSFHDDQHKPEMVVAVSRFEGLSGFRRPGRVVELMAGLRGDLVGRMREILEADPTAEGVRAAFTLALHARQEPDVATDLAVSVADVRSRVAAGTSSPRADATVLMLAEQHPGDPGAIVSLMLNRVTLEPGESMFVPAGDVHAYLSGCAVEVMASSDNVLRAGLTSKRVDVDALLECATCTPAPAARPRVSRAPGGLKAYRAPIPEFALLVGRVRPGRDAVVHPSGPRVALCLEGEVRLRSWTGEEHTLRQGESAFVPHDVGDLALAGAGIVVVAYVP
ncbi:mannose-6-phosphate isomerase, class I [Oerskovia flava]|uniref:mannose-6-phosphate isomerase, class I n=1 Tax=Oerskovia flava TaxID=2986422 RepID=UPI00223F0F4B|nr:mannose-6-phosphate isomerase, class I [Oerskovia sp. JB1-3-2]